MSPFVPAFHSAWAPPFRGEIYDYASKINLQDGYAKTGLFNVHCSRYLIDVFKSLKDPRIRSEVDVKAVQTAGSLTSDLSIPYRIEHDKGPMLLLMQDDKFAKTYCETRLMPMLERIPEIASILEGIDLNDKKKTTILFPGNPLEVGGLNEGNVQGLSWRYVTVDEGWRAKSNGLIRQAKARTTAFPHTHKFHLISQAGVEEDDLDIEWKMTNMKEWCWRCKACGRLNIWEWNIRRDDNSWAGILWDENERTRPDGKWNMSEVLTTIRGACRYCPEIWLDTPEVRRRLDDQGEYIITNPGALPANSGHHWPAMASPDISLAFLVELYLSAKYQEEEFGYKLPLMEFYQKRLARPWSHNTGVEIAILTSEPYDVDKAWPEEAFKFMTVDCQKDFTKFYVQICAWSAKGHIRELFWECLESWEQVKKVQERFTVKDQHVFCDLGYEQTRVAAVCIKHGHAGIIKGRRMYLCWTGLKGSFSETFAHKIPKLDARGKPIRDKEGKIVMIIERRIYSEIGYISTSIGRASKSIPCPFFSWSNLHAKDILKRYRDGEQGKVQWLPDKLPANDNESASNQMHSEYRTRVVDPRTGRRTDRWLPIGKRPNHKWDCMAMQIIAANIAGIIGVPEPVIEIQAVVTTPRPLDELTRGLQ